MSLDRLQAMLAIQGAEKKAHVVPVKNDPPKFVFSQTPAVLVTIDGEPVWRPVAGTALERVLNSRALVLSDPTGKLYIHLLDGFVQATALSGPWTVATSVPAGADQAAQALAKENVVDLHGGPARREDEEEAVAEERRAHGHRGHDGPTELIVTDGAPDWVPIDGTQLLYVKNTTGNVFKDLADQQTYVLVTGRWFRAADFGGPWQYVAGLDLPPDFYMIPDDSPKENVKASVPGTPQAQEAVIADEIPETAVVDRTKALVHARTSTARPTSSPSRTRRSCYVVQLADADHQGGTNSWYASRAASGSWPRRSPVRGRWPRRSPPAIYSIPPSSPLYYVTYVKVYDVSPSPS